MESISNLYNIPNYSPLVEVIDRQKGFVLLKNLCSTLSENRMYSVAVETEDGRPFMPNDPNNTWIKAEQADEVMRNCIKNSSYNKATTNFFDGLVE